MATGTVILNCARIEDPGVAAIDYLARLTLGLRRGGCKTCLANPNTELLELIDLVGLAEVLGARLVDVKWQPEQREESCGVEEERELPDPPV